MCGWSGAAGVPLIAMMPNDVTSANATLTGPSGPIQTCVLHKGNVSDGTAKVDPRRRQRGDRHAARRPRRRHLHGDRQLERRQRHVVVHDQPQRPAFGPGAAAPARADDCDERDGCGPLRAGDAVPVRRQQDRVAVGSARAQHRHRDPDHERSRHPRRQRQLREHRLRRRRLPDALQLHEQPPRGEHARVPAGDGRRQPSVRAVVERQDVPVLDERHRRGDRHQRLLPPWQRRRLHADHPRASVRLSRQRQPSAGRRGAYAHGLRRLPRSAR